MGHRFLRMLAAAGLLAGAFYTLAPYVFSYVATSAVVNAPIVTVRSPFDGVVIRASGEIASSVGAGDTLLQVSANRVDRTSLAELEARRTAVTGELAALTRQRGHLIGLRDRLTKRKAAHVAHATAWLDARQIEVQSRIDAARLRLADTRSDAARNRRLADRGALSRVSLEEAEYGEAIAESVLAGERASLERLAVIREALQAGVPLADGGDGLTQIIGRLDELVMRLAELERRHATLEARHAALNGQIAYLNARADLQEAFAPKASTSGIVWKASPPVNMPVLVGDELVRLLDCGRRFIEVAITERHFENIHPGDSARVRLKGASGWIEGRVEAVRGAKGRLDRPTLAAIPPDVADSQLSVTVRLPPADATRSEIARAFCDVGRTADVRFEKPQAAASAHLYRIVARLSAMISGTPG